MTQMALKADWWAVPEGKLHPETIPAGTVLHGELLAWAEAQGLVEPVEPQADTVKPAVEPVEPAPAAGKGNRRK